MDERNWKPGNRRSDGIDDFMLQKVTADILKAMAENGWNQGEAEKLPEYIKGAIERNSKRRRDMQPFAVCED